MGECLAPTPILSIWRPRGVAACARSYPAIHYASVKGFTPAQNLVLTSGAGLPREIIKSVRAAQLPRFGALISKGVVCSRTLRRAAILPTLVGSSTSHARRPLNLLTDETPARLLLAVFPSSSRALPQRRERPRRKPNHNRERAPRSAPKALSHQAAPSIGAWYIHHFVKRARFNRAPRHRRPHPCPSARRAQHRRGGASPGQAGSLASQALLEVA
jgi:hypothetical protein